MRRRPLAFVAAAALAGTLVSASPAVAEEVRFTAFTVSPQVTASSFQVSGQVLGTRAAESTNQSETFVWVELQFSTDKKTWTSQVEHWLDKQGRFAFGFSTSRDGYWRVLVKGTGVATAPVRVDKRTGTDMTFLNVSPEPARKGQRVYLYTGVIQLKSRWAGYAGQWVYIYFRPYGGKTWSYVTVAKTDSAGYVRKAITATRSGTWRAVYKGSATHMRAESPTDYVTVR
ncbi:hypothetical protein [Actinomadura craniellae]|uniref:hypothetical protein n=1 Tax=Actinomadura craniellae TaxID=2231787 RepID=UPI0013145405|nr:hypothetical protein [Actinomadura craniellae]